MTLRSLINRKIKLNIFVAYEYTRAKIQWWNGYKQCLEVCGKGSHLCM